MTSVIIGANRIEQLTDNLGAASVALDAAAIARLDAVSQAPPACPQWMQSYFVAAHVPDGGRFPYPKWGP